MIWPIKDRTQEKTVIIPAVSTGEVDKGHLFEVSFKSNKVVGHPVFQGNGDGFPEARNLANKALDAIYTRNTGNLINRVMCSREKAAIDNVAVHIQSSVTLVKGEGASLGIALGRLMLVGNSHIDKVLAVGTVCENTNQIAIKPVWGIGAMLCLAARSLGNKNDTELLFFVPKFSHNSVHTIADPELLSVISKLREMKVVVCPVATLSEALAMTGTLLAV